MEVCRDQRQEGAGQGRASNLYGVSDIWLLAPLRSIPLHQKSGRTRTSRSQSPEYACWHMNPHENSAMWGYYTTSSEAVAVRTSYATLRAALPAYVEMGVVRYIDYATGRLPSMNMFEYIMHKDNYYGFEQEVRAVGTPPAVKELGLEDFTANHFELGEIPGFLVYAPPVDMGKLIHGVVLHPDASDTFTQKVAVDGGLNPRKSGAGPKTGTELAVEPLVARSLAGRSLSMPKPPRGGGRRPAFTGAYQPATIDPEVGGWMHSWQLSSSVIAVYARIYAAANR